MGAIFGSPAKSSSTSDSHSFNNAWPQLKDQFSGVAGQAGNATNALSALLGIGGDPTKQNAAFDNFKNSSGYDFKMKAGQDAITTSNAAKGLLDSGSTGKALATFGHGLADSTLNDYMGQVSSLGNQGIAAGGLLSDAGKESTAHSTSTEKGAKKGIGGLLGSVLAA